MPTKPDFTKGEPTRDTLVTGEREPLIEIRDLHVDFALRTSAFARLVGGSSGTVRAVDGVNLTLGRGEVVGLVGESGSGKSTLGRALLGLVQPTGGSITYRGQELVGLSESRFRPLRRRLQMVFQDPHASMNPSMTIGKGIGDALRIHGLHPENRRGAVAEVLERVGLAPASRFIDKYPAELSGGQKQRAVIARAIALGPELLVADEPISMLDMSVRAKILGLMSDLRRDLDLTYLYITHDLASARFFCDRVAIMYLGKIVEIGPVEEIFDNPRHPYTQALLRAVPDPDPSRLVPRELPRGEIPDAAAAPLGCSFHPRCPAAFGPCGWEARDMRMILEQRWTTVPAEQYDTEHAYVRDGARFATASSPTSALVHSGSPKELLAVLEAERDGHPDEPLWSGVRGMSAEGNGVRVELNEPIEPQLRPAGAAGAHVSCHLFHDAATGEPREDIGG